MPLRVEWGSLRGDLYEHSPFETTPMDGFTKRSKIEVQSSPFQGESIPVDDSVTPPPGQGKITNDYDKICYFKYNFIINDPLEVYRAGFSTPINKPPFGVPLMTV